MSLFSGTSLGEYEKLILKSKKSKINLPFFTEDFSIAFGFAIKRAKQDKSYAVIIDLTNRIKNKIENSV